MRGCGRREFRQHKQALAAGWYAENFRRAGKQLRDLSHYLKQLDGPATPQAAADEAAAIFEGLAKQGKVRIRVQERND